MFPNGVTLIGGVEASVDKAEYSRFIPLSMDS